MNLFRFKELVVMVLFWPLLLLVWVLAPRVDFDDEVGVER